MAEKTFRNIMPYAGIVPSHHVQIAWIRQDICSHLEAKKKNRHKCLVNRKFHTVYAQPLVFSRAHVRLKQIKFHVRGLYVEQAVSQLVYVTAERLELQTIYVHISCLFLFTGCRYFRLGTYFKDE